MRLSLLTITNAEPLTSFTWELARVGRNLGKDVEVVVARDGHPCPYEDIFRCVSVASKGYVESVLDEAVAACRGDYILRLDDDERVSAAMGEWLRSDSYRAAPSWNFPRVNLWKNPHTMILTPPLWPDCQTRLTTKVLAGGRSAIHAQAKVTGQEAPVVIEHHQFLVKTRQEREAKAARYEALQPGAGTGHYLPFSVPESLGALDLASYEGGRLPLFHRWTRRDQC